MTSSAPGRRRVTHVIPFAFIAALAVPGVAFAADTPQQVTFSKDVAPIFQAKCQNCHHVGAGAPMPLTTYEESRPWARSIKARVQNREMPPWHLDKTVGIRKYKNDISLTDREITTISAWVDGGAVQGSPADLPPARKLAPEDAWHIVIPYLVVPIPGSHQMSEKAPPLGIDDLGGVIT